MMDIQQDAQAQHGSCTPCVEYRVILLDELHLPGFQDIDPERIATLPYQSWRCQTQQSGFLHSSPWTQMLLGSAKPQLLYLLKSEAARFCAFASVSDHHCWSRGNQNKVR